MIKKFLPKILFEWLNRRTNINGHEYVCLGLPSGLKWATCNVGATSPEEYGSYFAWGETSPKSEYTEDNCKAYGKNLGDISGSPIYDAARANWGGSWRMPTKAEFEELLNNCNWEWTSQGGHNGYKVTSKRNGKSIFFSAAGYYYEACNSFIGEYCEYWSSTPYYYILKDKHKRESGYACGLSLSNGHSPLLYDYVCKSGRSVRAVSD